MPWSLGRCLTVVAAAVFGPTGLAACGADDCNTCGDAIAEAKYCHELTPFCEDGDHELACNMVAGCLRNSCGTTCPSGMRQLSEPGCGACATEHCSSELLDCRNQ